jgi:hypothetical protein
MLPPIANMTGRPSTIAGNHVSGRAKMSAPASINKSAVASSRHAMSDRTNGHTKALNDPTLEKVIQSCIKLTLFGIYPYAIFGRGPDCERVLAFEGCNLIF